MGGQNNRTGSLTPVVKWLLIANVTVFFVDLLLADRWGTRVPTAQGFEVLPPIQVWGAFAVESAVREGHLWEFLSFQFLHGGLFHLLANSMGLYFFGPWMERWWGTWRFLLFYLLCGVGGGLLYTLLVLADFLPSGYLVGASAGIYGILVGVAIVAPSLRVRLLFPPVEMSMRTLAIAVLAFAAGAVVFRIGGNVGGEAGHLGGAIVGFLLMICPFLLGKNSPRWSKIRNYEPKIRPRTEMNLRSDSEVDRVLDKISREGFQSLTAEDKKILERAKEKYP